MRTVAQTLGHCRWLGLLLIVPVVGNGQVACNNNLSDFALFASGLMAYQSVPGAASSRRLDSGSLLTQQKCFLHKDFSAVAA